ncbi:MAG TPA: peptidylprolyl isomerase [Solirubrobacteraceae bacterium]|jgi:hypothetical protein|nr:peptidylprolyl isomerase [Solirubrobacteraceae bacterium]
MVATAVRQTATAAIAALLVVGIVACGSSSEGPPVVRVGTDAIGKSVVGHWAHVIQRGGAAQGLRGAQHGAPRQRALSLLISMAWISGEAAREHIVVPARVVNRELAERQEANGKAEFQGELRASGETVADVKREIRAELEATAIRERLTSQGSHVTRAEIVSFYRLHGDLFVVPEERDAELIEDLPSSSAATALVGRIGTGSRFAKRALKEALVRSRGGTSNPQDIQSVTNAIFAARPGVVSKPMRLNHAWTVFLVRKVKPAKPKPLTEVRGEVVQRLTAIRLREITMRFEKEYENRWAARTSCSAGYVVRKCAQYAGKPVAGESPFSGE